MMQRALAVLAGRRDTEQATTSDATKDFTAPAWSKRVTMMLDGVSLSGTDELLVQLGDAGGVETTGYVSAVGRITTAGASTATESTAGFLLDTAGAAASGQTGVLTITLMDPANNTWVASGTLMNGNGAVHYATGIKSLSGPLTTVRLAANGSDTFDAGAVNALYE